MFESSRNHLMPEGAGATLSDEGDLPTLRLRMSRAGSSNSIFDKSASIKTSPHTQSHGRLGFNGCDIPADIARARSSSLADELAPYVHSDNDFLPGKLGTKPKIHTWKRTA